MDATFRCRWDELKNEVESWLDRCLPAEGDMPGELHRSMRYSVLGGGKRLRGVLVAGVAEALGCREEERFLPACALELVHAYSLIHDDLPAMDDDDLRRGQPTNHKVFGEATAILAGDALLTYAFWLLARHPSGQEWAPFRARFVEELACAAGTPAGMVAGQALDMAATGSGGGAGLLRDIHRLKTGALIRGAVRIGALLGRADESVLSALTEYAEALGLAFQVTDDVLDCTATAEELGKTPGKDAHQGKLTYPALYGLPESRRLASEAVDRCLEALEAVEAAGGKTDFLRAVARYVLERTS